MEIGVFTYIVLTIYLVGCLCAAMLVNNDINELCEKNKVSGLTLDKKPLLPICIILSLLSWITVGIFLFNYLKNQK